MIERTSAAELSPSAMAIARDGNGVAATEGRPFE
jgi:hypothetical protein